MEYKHNFAGVSSNSNIPVDKEFEIIYDNGDYELDAVSKREFQCYLGSKTINYRIGLQIQDGAEFDSDGKMYVNLYLIPCYRNLHKKNKENFFASYAGGLIDEKDYGKKDDMNYFQDAIWDGTYVVLHYETIDYDSSEDYLAKQQKILEDCANTYQAITGLIGFHLDRYQNRIGYTG